MTTQESQSAAARIDVLGNEAGESPWLEHCRRWMQSRHHIDDDCAASASRRILIVSRDGCAGISDWLAVHDVEIHLLIALDQTVLQHAALLSHCLQLLLAPFDQTALERQLESLSGPPAVDPIQEALLETNIIGHSSPMQALRRQIPMVASYDAPVAILGETGTGKELVARAVHYCSQRKDMPFVPINCAALNDELLLAELFGHERGAFTDARQARRGLVAQAQGGTLFLDEVDSLSPRAQGALLRFLQDSEYRPVGGEHLLKADVRIVSATNRDFRGWVDDGNFREDLYYRLNVVDLRVPALRDRAGDLELLSAHFLERLAHQYKEAPKRLHPLTQAWMDSYHWPGNVRELENHLHRCHVMSHGSTILAPSLCAAPVAMVSNEIPLGDFQQEKAKAVGRFERDYLQRVLEIVGGNVSEAARRAGKERRAFTRLLDKHKIDRQRFRTGDGTETDHLRQPEGHARPNLRFNSPA